VGGADVCAGVDGADGAGVGVGVEPLETSGGAVWLAVVDARRVVVGFGAACALRPGKARAANPAKTRASAPAPAANTVVVRRNRCAAASLSRMRFLSMLRVNRRRMNRL
jgi:hypothetical protein